MIELGITLLTPLWYILLLEVALNVYKALVELEPFQPCPSEPLELTLNEHLGYPI